MLIRCPSCHTEYTLQLTSAGALCTCFRCAHEFYVDIEGSTSQRQATPPTQQNPTVDASDEPSTTVEEQQVDTLPENKKATLDEQIESIDAKYKSFEDEFSWGDDSALSLDTLDDGDIPELSAEELKSITPSLEEQLANTAEPVPESVKNDPPQIKKETDASKVSPEKTEKKRRFWPWKRSKEKLKSATPTKKEDTKKTKKTKKRRLWRWKKGNTKKNIDKPAVKKEAPIIPAPKKKKHRIWPWITLILLVLMAAGLWVKREAWMHQPLVRSVLLQSGMSKTASNEDWFIDHKTIKMRWQKDLYGKQVLIIEGNIDNRLTLPLPLPQFEARFANHPNDPILLHSILTSHTADAVTGDVTKHPAWLDQTPVAAHESRVFVLVLPHVSTDGDQRVMIRAVAGEKKK